MFGVPPIWVSVKYHGYSLSEHTPLQAVVVEKNKYRGYFNNLTDDLDVKLWLALGRLAMKSVKK